MTDIDDYSGNHRPEDLDPEDEPEPGDTTPTVSLDDTAGWPIAAEPPF